MLSTNHTYYKFLSYQCGRGVRLRHRFNAVAASLTPNVSNIMYSAWYTLYEVHSHAQAWVEV